MRSPGPVECQELNSAEGGTVREALAVVLASRPFRNTLQCSALLRYIVEHTLSHEGDLLRERVIGAEVFKRPPGYETNEDPIVRLRVAEVRKRLAQYYSELSGNNDVKIDIPSGSYRAVFHFHSHETYDGPFPAEPALLIENVSPPIPSPHPLGEPVGPPQLRTELDRTLALPQSPLHLATDRPAPHKAFLLLLLAAILVALLGSAFLLKENTGEERSFRAFWSPWSGSKTPVIVAIGSNAVYRLRPDYVSRYAQQHGLEAQGQEIYVPFDKENPVSGQDLIPAYNTFVMWGDVAAVSDISAHLADAHQIFQDRFPNDISFAEIRNTPSILIGGFNNPMTIALTRHLQFVMTGGGEILNTAKPDQKWTLQDLNTADYAILTRLVRNDGDAPELGAAGLGQYGTLAVVKLICDPASFYLLSRQLPSDWATKNLQAVLRISIVNFKPTVINVVAARTW